ncbi:tetratricopeptide repeat protein, partial [Candidatus Poribacteria bacterium]|nr:tetratricopeptide repeat protein [Candidatus Poribacteria bacterium]
DSENAGFYNSRGITYKDMGKIDLAMKDYNKAIELDPEFPEVYNNLGIIYDEKGEHDCAIKNYSKAIELKSYYVSAYNNRGRAYRVKGNIELAIEDFKTAIIGESDFAEAYYNLCETYLFKGDLECAYTDLTKLAILLSSPYACFARGIIGLCQQQWKQAIADFTVAEDNGVDIVALFTNGYKSIEDFEETNDIQIPEDIREMLSPQ